MKKFLLFFFLFVLGVVALSPTLLSSVWGKNILISLLEKSTHYKIEIGELKLRWLGPQTVEHLNIHDAEPLFACEKIECTAPLWRLLTKKDLQELYLFKPALTLKTSNIKQPVSLLRLQKASLVPSLHLSFLPRGGSLRLEQGELTLLHAKKTLVRYDALNIEAHVPDSQTFVSWEMTGKTTEGSITGSFQTSGKIEERGPSTIAAEFSSFPLRGVDALLAHVNPKMEGLLLELLGPSLNLTLKGSLSSEKADVVLNASTPLFTAELQMTGDEGAISLAKPGKIVHTLTKKLFPALKTPLQTTILIQDLKVPLHDLSDASFSTILTLDPMKTRITLDTKKLSSGIQVGMAAPGFSLSGATVALKGSHLQLLSPALVRVMPQARGFAELLPQNSMLAFEILGDFDLTKGDLRANSNVTINEKDREWASGKITAQGAQLFSQPKWNFDVNAQGREINVSGSFMLNQDLLQITKPCELFFTLTDESFKSDFFELSQPSVLALSVSRLSLPLSKGWKRALFTAEAGFDKFAFQDKQSGQQVKLSELQLKVSKKEADSPLSFNLTSKDDKISCKGKLADMSDLAHLSAELDAEITQLPTAILDLVAHICDTSSLSPLFGDKLDAKARLSLQKGSGPIELNVNSSNTRLSLNGEMQEGVLLLAEPVYAQVLMTEELSELLLKKVNPLSISSLTSPNPLTLQIEPSKFSLPLADWRKLSLSQARIELGQLSCQNEGSLQTVLNLLKSKELSQEKLLHLWFAPIDLSIQEGVIAVQRTEILIDQTYEVASWGTLDLQKGDVDMTLGLTSQCLSKAFSISDLPNDYVMQIPMKGKMNSVKMDSKVATAKIAALLVWQKSTASNTSKNSGLIARGFGELMGQLATLPDRKTPAPPAKHPFPWEKYKPSGKERKSENPTQPPLKKKNKIKKGDKPLKQLLKILR